MIEGRKIAVYSNSGSCRLILNYLELVNRSQPTNLRAVNFIQRRYWPHLGSALIQWIGLKENLQEAMIFPQNGGGACNFSLKQIHWFISLGPPSMLCPIYIPWPSLNHGIWRFYASILGLIFRSSPAWIMWKVWCFKASCRPQLDSPFPVPATSCRQYLEPPFLTLYRQNLFLSKHFDGIYND